MKIKTCIWLCVLCGSAAATTKPVRLTYTTLGGSLYGVLADQEGPYGLSKDSYFTALKFTVYLQVFGWTVAAGIPEQLTLEIFDFKPLSRYGIHPGDFSVQVGRRWGRISPRLVFKTPLGYPTSDDVAWIGSGNMRAGAGAGVKLGSIVNGRIRFTGDMEVLTTINDTAGYPRMGIGSLSGYAALKAGAYITGKLSTSLQAYSDFGSIRYSDWSALEQRSITIAPLLSLSYRIGKRMTVNGWGGYGVKFSSLYDGTTSRVIITGLSAGYGW
jgi:hypothetical protein